MYLKTTTRRLNRTISARQPATFVLFLCKKNNVLCTSNNYPTDPWFWYIVFLRILHWYSTEIPVMWFWDWFSVYMATRKPGILVTYRWCQCVYDYRFTRQRSQHWDTAWPLPVSKCRQSCQWAGQWYFPVRYYFSFTTQIVIFTSL